ncbi:MAG: NAD(P)-dependent oxidoreductase [Bacteroidaceae bacterium]|nr:NAD(P)-dependent oxidoreductase [Bacteroidaceae bacterium]
MSKTILITGTGPTGVTGKRIKEYLSAYSYFLLTPSSAELDLTDDGAVSHYFSKNNIDYVIHCATYRPNIGVTTHFVDEIFESNLRMFYNLAKHNNRYAKMIYFGSGAEFGKSRDIINVTEDDFRHSIPKDKYGFGKYIMNQYCRRSENIYNLRLFGTLNPYERYTKNVVSNLCAKAIKSRALSLKQNCCFSFVDIDDVCQALLLLLETTPKYHDYNFVQDNKYMLLDIAMMVKELSCSSSDVVFDSPGLNFEYTANNSRWVSEFGFKFKPIFQSVKDIYEYWLGHENEIEVSDIDRRWTK